MKKTVLCLIAAAFFAGCSNAETKSVADAGKVLDDVVVFDRTCADHDPGIVMLANGGELLTPEQEAARQQLWTANGCDHKLAKVGAVQTVLSDDISAVQQAQTARN